MPDDMSAVLAMFESLDKKLDTITSNMVGLDRCKESRARCLSENGVNFREIFERLKDCEEQCSVFKAIKPALPTEADILKAESNAAAAARAGDLDIMARLDDIDNKLKIFDVTYWSMCHVRDIVKNNKIAQIVVGCFLLVVFENSLSFVGVMLGRLHDFYPTWLFGFR